MKLLLGLLLVVVALPTALYFTAPKLLSRPYILLANFGLMPEPDVVGLIPDSPKIAALLTAQTPSQNVLTQMIDGLGRAGPDMKRIATLEHDINAKKAALLGEAPPENRTEENYLKFEEGMNKAKGMQNFDADIALGVMIKGEAQIMGAPGLSLLKSYPAFLIAKSPVEIPVSSYLLSSDAVKSGIISFIRNFLEGKAEAAKINPLIDYFEQSKFNLVFSQGFPVMEIELTLKEPLKLYFSSITSHSFVLSTDLDILSEVLDQVTGGTRSPATQNLVTEAANKTIFLSVDVNNVIQSAGPAGAMGKMFVGGLTRMDIFVDTSEMVSAGVNGVYPSADEAKGGVAKLEAMLGQAKDKRPSWFTPKIAARESITSLSFSIPLKDLIDKLLVELSAKTKRTERKWQVLTGVSNYRLTNNLNVSKFETGKNVTLPAKLFVRGSPAKPLVFFVPGGCAGRDAIFSLKGKGQSLFIHPMYTGEIPKDEWVLTNDEDEFSAFVVKSEKPYDEISFELRSSPGKMFASCKFQFPPFLLSQ